MRCLPLSPLLLVLAACSSAPNTAPQPVNTGLEALSQEQSPGEGEPSDPWSRAAADLQTLLADRDQHADATNPIEGSPRAPTLAEPTSLARLAKEGDEEPTRHVDADPEIEAEGGDDAEAAEPSAVLAIPAPTPATLAERLRGLILERASASTSPISDAARAALIEGALGIPTDAEAAGLNLHESERARLDALRRLAASLTQEDLSSDAVLAELERLSAELNASLRAFRLREAVICSEVRGLGDYDSMELPTLLVGNTHRLLVYTEPDRFATRERSDNGTSLHEVEISQELTLYHDAPGDLQVWHHPRERIKEASRRPKRDFYLVHEIELPRRLSVGSYLLRVSARDEVAGTTAERTIPIRIVADPSLIR